MSSRTSARRVPLAAIKADLVARSGNGKTQETLITTPMRKETSPGTKVIVSVAATENEPGRWIISTVTGQATDPALCSAFLKPNRGQETMLLRSAMDSEVLPWTYGDAIRSRRGFPSFIGHKTPDTSAAAVINGSDQTITTKPFT